MSDPKNPNIASRNTPQWALYQRELFWKDNTGELPPFSTEPGDLEDLAKRALTIGGWYVFPLPISTPLLILAGITLLQTQANPTPISQTDKPSTVIVSYHACS